MKLVPTSLGLGALAASLQLASATVVLQVDFENSVDPGGGVPVITQAGWTAMVVSNAPAPAISSVSTTIGSTGITVSAGGAGGFIQGRAANTWNNMSGTSWNNMVEDVIAARGGDGTATISLTGLNDVLDYTLTVWHNVSAIDSASFAGGLYAINPSIATGTQIGASTSGQATNWTRNTVPLASDGDFVNSIISFNSSGGAADVLLTNPSGNGFLVMSGLQLDAIPEPSGVTLLGLAGLGLLLRRRR